MNDEQEAQLIKRAQKGDEAAFEMLINARYETMYKMAYKYCGNKQDAQDITQDSCIKLARGIGSFNHKSKFTSWLYTLVINTAKDWFDKNNRHRGSGDELETLAVSSTAQETAYMNEVWAEIHKLPEGEKDAVILVLSEGHSHAEAAKILKVKEKTVSWRVHEARKKLEAIFGQEKHYG